MMSPTFLRRRIRIHFSPHFSLLSRWVRCVLWKKILINRWAMWPFYILLLTCITTSVVTSENTKIISYDPGELLAKIFKPNVNVTSRQRGYGLVFEDDGPQRDEDQGQYNLITFEENNHRLKFQNEDDQDNAFQSNPDLDGRPGKPLRFEDQDLIRDQVTLQDDNRIDPSHKKRKRRRRKPKNGFDHQGIPQNFQGGPNYQGFDSRPGVGGFGPNPYPVNPEFGPDPGYPGPVPHRRRRRPRPSLASDALSAVTGALTSIALYDDYQCVPRLLCEAAGGGSLGANGVLDSIAGIQPLLTLLGAYNGISSSPLFVFGRAVFLGMTSKGHTGTCRYAYPQCPTDPQQLIYYLNNHNGGFFRFFNSPGADQNLEQFYNYLGQNGQFVDPNGQYLGQNGQLHGPQEPNYGQGNYQGYDQNQQLYQQGGYGLYQNNQGYGSQSDQFGQSPVGFGQNYGSNYDYNTYGSNNIRYKTIYEKIEKRIQNKPAKDDLDENDDNFDTKLQFPETDHNDDRLPFQNDEDIDSLRFPEEFQKDHVNNDSTRKGKSILFPENLYNQNAYSNKNYVNLRIENSYRPTSRPYHTQNYYNENQNAINANVYKQTTASPFNENDYYYDHKHNFYVKKNNNQINYNNNQIYHNNHRPNYNNNNYKDQNKINYNTNNFYNNGQKPIYNYERYPVNYVNYNNYVDTDKDNRQTVYIVRGNGDPNRPEIVKVRPGQTVN